MSSTSKPMTTRSKSNKCLNQQEDDCVVLFELIKNSPYEFQQNIISVMSVIQSNGLTKGKCRLCKQHGNDDDDDTVSGDFESGYISSVWDLVKYTSIDVKKALISLMKAVRTS